MAKTSMRPRPRAVLDERLQEANALVAHWLGSKRDRRGYAHEQAMAREVRVQERLEQAYIALGEYLSRFEDWARSVHPFLGPVPAPDPPPPGYGATGWQPPHGTSTTDGHGSKMPHAKGAEVANGGGEDQVIRVNPT